MLLLIYILLILYIFSWISFFFFPNMFKYEAVDKNNELVSPNYLEESICSSSVPCILYFMNFGLSSEGSIEMNLISFKQNTSFYLFQFFFEIFLFLFIHMISFNIVLATITNAYDNMKEKIDKKGYEDKNVCFICGKTKNDCIGDNEDFDDHLEKHDKWKYIIYIVCLILKKEETFTIEEDYVWKQIKDKKLDWFPKYEKNFGERKSEEKNSDEKKSGEKNSAGKNSDEKKMVEEKIEKTTKDNNINNNNFKKEKISLSEDLEEEEITYTKNKFKNN